MVGGYLLAGALLPDVAASPARALRRAACPGSLGLGAGLVGGRARHERSLGALAAGGRSLVARLRGCRCWRRRSPRPGSRRGAAGAAARARARRGGSALGALAALAFGRGLPAGFAVIGGLLLAAALALPAALGAARRARRPRRRAGRSRGWFWADARQALGPLSLALMALLLALAVNVGVGTMVESFRRTFLGYLDQRLAAELYVAARDDAEAAAIGAWLEARPEVDGGAADLERAGAGRRLAGRGLRLPRPCHLPRQLAADRRRRPTPGTGWRAATAALVSEQLARRFGALARRRR